MATIAIKERRGVLGSLAQMALNPVANAAVRVLDTASLATAAVYNPGGVSPEELFPQGQRGSPELDRLIMPITVPPGTVGIIAPGDLDPAQEKPWSTEEYAQATSAVAHPTMLAVRELTAKLVSISTEVDIDKAHYWQVEYNGKVFYFIPGQFRVANGLRNVKPGDTFTIHPEEFQNNQANLLSTRPPVQVSFLFAQTWAHAEFADNQPSGVLFVDGMTHQLDADAEMQDVSGLETSQETKPPQRKQTFTVSIDPGTNVGGYSRVTFVDGLGPQNVGRVIPVPTATQIPILKVTSNLGANNNNGAGPGSVPWLLPALAAYAWGSINELRRRTVLIDGSSGTLEGCAEFIPISVIPLISAAATVTVYFLVTQVTEQILQKFSIPTEVLPWANAALNTACFALFAWAIIQLSNRVFRLNDIEVRAASVRIAKRRERYIDRVEDGLKKEFGDPEEEV